MNTNMDIMEDLDEIIETTEKNLQGLKDAKEVINRVFLDSFYHNWSIDVDVTGNIQKKPKVQISCFNRCHANCRFVFSYCFANKQNKKKLKLVAHDFYSVDCDIKDIGTDLEDKRLKTNIVDEYQTVFDNIGTQDKCFVKSSDISYLNSIVDLYYKLRDYYRDAFYKNDLNTFTCQIGSNEGIPMWVCDPFLEAFINKSHIYYDENIEDTIILTINNLMDGKFNLDFSKSLYDAVLKRSTEMLCRYPYVYYTFNDKRFSTFAFSDYPSMKANLIMNKQPIIGADDSFEYDEETGKIIKHGDPTDPDYKTEIDGIYVDNVDVADQRATYNIPWYSIYNTPKWIPTWTCKSAYFNFKFIASILDGKLETNDYCELIIFNYLNNISMEYDRKEIIDHLEENLHNYYFLPMIIYILGQLYQNYFKKDKVFEL